MNFKWTVGKKLMGLGLLGAVLVFGVGYAGYWGISSVDMKMDAITSGVSVIRNHVEADMMHDAIRADVLEAFLVGERGSQEEKKRVLDSLSEHTKQFREHLTENKTLAQKEEIRQAIDAASSDLERYLEKASEISKLAFQNGAVAVSRLGEFMELFKSLEADMSKISDLIEDDAKESQSQGDTATVFFKRFMFSMMFVALLLMAGVSYFIARTITVSVAKMMEGISRGAEGDLTRRIDLETEDELGQTGRSFNRMLESLVKVLNEVRDTAESVSSASSQISQGNNDLSQRTSEQASALEETSSAMEEITSTVKQNADNAKQANQLGLAARDIAEKGGKVTMQAVTAMAEVNKSSKKIADIITVIDEIAFQTNLLALNAAVEAARAGEHGRGFAVVAAEVRNLAQRSATAAKEIKGLINESVQKVAEGNELVIQSGKTLEEIMESVKRVTDIIGEISAASQEQSSGIDQVNKAIMQMDEVTQQNAAMVEELSSASQAMMAQAKGLMERVEFFKIKGADGEHRRATIAGMSPTGTKPAQKKLQIHARTTRPDGAVGTSRLEGNESRENASKGKGEMMAGVGASSMENGLGHRNEEDGFEEF